MLKLLPAILFVFIVGHLAWSEEISDLVKDAREDAVVPPPMPRRLQPKAEPRLKPADRTKAPHVLQPPAIEDIVPSDQTPSGETTTRSRLLREVVPPIPDALKRLEADDSRCLSCAQINVGRPMDPEMIQQIRDYLENVEREKRYRKKAEEINSQPLAPLPNVGNFDGVDYALACRNFIREPPKREKTDSALGNDTLGEDASLGPWGKIVVDAINELASDCLLGPSTDEVIANPDSLDRMIKLRDVCPNFRYFDKKRREHFYVYAFASISMTESSCNPDAQAPGKHGTAAGLMGMEKDIKWRDAAKIRKEPCYPHPDDGLLTPVNNLRCAVSVMSVDACGLDGTMQPRAKINDWAGYWEKLRGNGKATKLIKQYPQCFD